MTMPSQPSGYPPCEDCGGRQVGNLRVLGQHHVGLHPGGRTVWMEPMLKLNAVVCLTCGRSKLFVANLPTLHQSVQQHPDWYTW